MGQVTGNGSIWNRSTALTSSNVTWQAVYNAASARVEMWHSSNDGVSWTERTGLRQTVPTTPTGLSIGCNHLDHLWMAVSYDSSDRTTVYGTNAAASSASSWAISTDSLNVEVTAMEMVVFQNNTTSTTVAVAMRKSGAFDELLVRCFTYNSSGVLTSAVTHNMPTGVDRLALDVEHTAAGVSTGKNPALWVAYEQSGSVYVRKLSGTATLGTWSIGAARLLTSNNGTVTSPLSAMFDGSRFVVVFSNNDTLKWYERNSGDTSTTNRSTSVPALSDGTLQGAAVTLTATGDSVVHVIGGTSDDVSRLLYDRTLGTFGSWETASTADAAFESNVSAARWTADIRMVYVWEEPGADIEADYYELIRNPNAPLWVSPSNNSAQAVDATLELVWEFSDPDAGDSQSAYALSRSINEGTLQYWNAGTTSWGASETKNTTTSESVTLAAAWATDDDSVEYKVKTWDSADLEGPYGSGLTVNASQPVTPVLTAPADAATISTPSVVVEWTATEQTAYQVRILDVSDVQVWSSGKVTSTDLTVTTPAILEDGADYSVEVTVWNDDDASGPTDSHDFDVSFVPPATPTLAVSTGDGFIEIVVTDPAPTGSQPTVTGHDLFVRVAAGGRQVGERTVDDDGIRIVANDPATTLEDYAAASGADFEYRVLSVAANGTSAYSAWT